MFFTRIRVVLMLSRSNTRERSKAAGVFWAWHHWVVLMELCTAVGKTPGSHFLLVNWSPSPFLSKISICNVAFGHSEFFWISNVRKACFKGRNPVLSSNIKLQKTIFFFWCFFQVSFEFRFLQLRKSLYNFILELANEP